MWWRRRDRVHAEGEFTAADRLDNEAEPDDEVLRSMGIALERLRWRHLAFRKAEREEVSALEELRLQILREVTARPSLEGYYAEAWGLTAAAPSSAREPATRRLRPHRPIAVMQVELMTRAFYVLQLHLFANAPENEGWMTLFRRWGLSRRFNEVFEELAPTLPPEFRKFYELYIWNLLPQASASGHMAIHHPWLPKKGGRGRGVYMDSGRMEGEIEMRSGAEGIVDHRGSEGADQTFETPAPPDSGGGAPNE